MIGILGEVGKALITLQNEGKVVLQKTEEVYVDEILYCVEKVLTDVKATYDVEELEKDERVKVELI
ncbi:hypothetical protein [Peribacillus sp. SCS-37]|uniref:hypothetical protein n=1 Tax=Paraperibacillus esterisolvens TaxID=3115296 RepID=UPI003905A6D3